jgi:nucleotide-binding universal stress UspA family protein
MDRIKKILVGIDFSPCSAAALLQAVRIAGWNAATINAVHVVPIPAYALPGGSFMPVEIPPLDLLIDAARDQWARWPVAKGVAGGVTFEAVLGPPRMELLDRVRRDRPDLLILGAHGEFDAHKGVGSTTSGCVQQAGTKVLVVRERQSTPFRAILACIDFTDTSRVVLEQAIRVAARDDATLHILHIFQDPWGKGPLADRLRHVIEQRLTDFCDPLTHQPGAPKTIRHVAPFDGHGKGIIDFLQRQPCDLAVLGTRSSWNPRDFFWGSTAERIVRDAPCAVLTVKPPGFEQP